MCPTHKIYRLKQILKSICKNYLIRVLYLAENHQLVQSKGLIADSTIASNPHLLTKSIKRYSSKGHDESVTNHLKKRQISESEEEDS